MPVINTENLEKELKTIVADIVEIDEDKVTSDAKFVEDLGMDSMMALEILATIEKKYQLKIPEENLTRITNLQQVMELVGNFLK